MSEIEKLNMIAEWQEQHKQLIEDLNNSKKRIEELEKENAQWKQRNETLKDALEHARKIYGDELEKSYKENAEFKEQLYAFDEEREKIRKENAELKKRVENQKSFLERIRAKFELGEINRKEIEGYLESDQLTNAKELLKKLYLEIRGYMNDQGFDMNVINEVYDFIKSEVEK